MAKIYVECERESKLPGTRPWAGLNTNPNSKSCFKSWTKIQTKNRKMKIPILAPGWLTAEVKQHMSEVFKEPIKGCIETEKCLTSFLLLSKSLFNPFT